MAGTMVTPRDGAVLERGMPPTRRVMSSWRSGIGGRTTPGRLRMMLGLLILASLAWGVLATFTVALHTSAAGTVVAASEPLTVDAEQIWRSLSDADDAATTAILAGGVVPPQVQQRYDLDIRQAKTAIEDAAARGGPATDLVPLSVELTAYEKDVATALAYNRLGYPLGAGYIRQASDMMHSQPARPDNLLSIAHDLYDTENARLTAASAQATGLPLVIVTVVAGLALGFFYYRASRWLLGRTHRVLNGGLLVASAAGAVALLWLAAAFAAGRADLLTAQAQGSVPVAALANADITSLKAHADESLTLINNAGNDSNEDDFKAQIASLLAPGTGQLAIAQRAAAGSPAAAGVQAAITDASAWQAAHGKVRAADTNGEHLKAVGLVQGSGTAGVAFGNLSLDLSNAIAADSAAFDANARSGQGAFTALEAGMIIATLVMAGGIAWGLSRRLAEYR